MEYHSTFAPSAISNSGFPGSHSWKIFVLTLCSDSGSGPLHRNLAHSRAGRVHTVRPSGTSLPSYNQAIRYRNRPGEAPSSTHTPNSPILHSQTAFSSAVSGVFPAHMGRQKVPRNSSQNRGISR